METSVAHRACGVVLIADIFDETASNLPVHLRRDLEKTERETLDTLAEAIRSLGFELHLYSGPEDLAHNAPRHKNDVVLSIYGGERSRNRMALVPAVCETFGLKFIGPDVYGRIVAQDKEISKRLALDCGLQTPSWRVIRTASDLEFVGNIKPPVVVKPMLEGSSIGVSPRSLVTESGEIVILAREILAQLGQPVLIEEFVPGREVAYCRIEGCESWAFSEIAMEGDDTYFDHHLFYAAEKLVRSEKRFVRSIDSELPPSTRDRLEQFLAAFGRFGYCRVDGRLTKEGFSFLEVTPDAWLGASGQFAMGFTNKGWTYHDVIAGVLASAR